MYENTYHLQMWEIVEVICVSREKQNKKNYNLLPHLNPFSATCVSEAQVL